MAGVIAYSEGYRSMDVVDQIRKVATALRRASGFPKEDVVIAKR